MGPIKNVQSLREHYAQPSERSQKKCIPALDRHMRDFIALSPFLCLASANDDGADVTPRGDAPGFVQVLDDRTVLVPDWPGNNRLDTLTNITSNPNVGLLFLIPGVEESLRVNGTCEIALDPALLNRWEVNGKHPKSVLKITVREAYLHCGKALIRSKLWSDDYKIDRDRLPPYGYMVKDQIAIDQTAEEIQSSVVDGYKNNLY